MIDNIGLKFGIHTHIPESCKCNVNYGHPQLITVADHWLFLESSD